MKRDEGAEEIEIMEEEPFSVSFSGTTEVDIRTQSRGVTGGEVGVCDKDLKVMPVVVKVTRKQICK